MSAIGLVPVVWLALIVASSVSGVSGGLPGIVNNFAEAINNPMSISWCGDSLKTALFFIAEILPQLPLRQRGAEKRRRLADGGKPMKMKRHSQGVRFSTVIYNI